MTAQHRRQACEVTRERTLDIKGPGEKVPEQEETARASYEGSRHALTRHPAHPATCPPQPAPTSRVPTRALDLGGMFLIKPLAKTEVVKEGALQTQVVQDDHIPWGHLCLWEEPRSLFTRSWWE